MTFNLPDLNFRKWKLRVGPKTQMGTTLSSYSHFVAFELLQPRRQATVIVVGRILIFFVLTHSVDLFSTHRFRVLLFTASPSGCSFGFPCGPPSRTECYWNTGWNFTCDLYFCCMEHCRHFSFPVPRNIARNLRLIFIRS